MEDNKRFEILLHKIPTWVSTALLVFTLSFFGYLIWNNNNLSNRILVLENQQIRNKPFQITKFEKDSLLLELNKYQQKEDYFTTALEVQAAHYEHITSWGITISAFLLAIVGLIGVGWFWSSYDKMKQKIVGLEEKVQNSIAENKKELEEKIESFKTEFKELQYDSYQLQVNLSVVISDNAMYGNERRFYYSIQAAYYTCKHIDLELNIETCLNNLNSAQTILEEIEEINQTELNHIREMLDFLLTIQNEEIKLKTIDIMYKLNQKTKKIATQQ